MPYASAAAVGSLMILSTCNKEPEDARGEQTIIYTHAHTHTHTHTRISVFMPFIIQPSVTYVRISVLWHMNSHVYVIKTSLFITNFPHHLRDDSYIYFDHPLQSAIQIQVDHSTHNDSG